MTVVKCCKYLVFCTLKNMKVPIGTMKTACRRRGQVTGHGRRVSHRRIPGETESSHRSQKSSDKRKVSHGRRVRSQEDQSQVTGGAVRSQEEQLGHRRSTAKSQEKSGHRRGQDT